MGYSSPRWMLGLLVGIACFSESPSDAMCRDGEVGCACGLACDAGLVCADDIELCIPENCVPGSELCTCNEGQCLAGLECTGGLCREPGGTGSHSADGSGSADDVASTQGSVTDPSTTGMTATESTSPTTTDPSTTMSSMTVDPSMTDPSLTDPSMTASDPTSDVASDGMDTGMNVDGAACHACLVDENGMGGDCEMQLAGCSANFPCVELANCVTACLDIDDPSCIAGCCIANPNGVSDYAGLADCHTAACEQMCVGFDLRCGGG